MKFEKHYPCQLLKPYINCFVVSESVQENEYKVFPLTGMVVGFQYQGHLLALKNQEEFKLSQAGITGITDEYKIFKNSPGIGSILVYFTETGFSHFSSHPANELFKLSLPLTEIFAENQVAEVEEKLRLANGDKLRVDVVEQFFISQLKTVEIDKLIVEAVRLIYQNNGNLRIKELSEKLFISPSPFEKRFRKIVGTSAKKFASIVRFNAVLKNLNSKKSLSELCYEHNFFDQAHFIKDFKQYTGDTPEYFKRLL